MDNNRRYYNDNYYNSGYTSNSNNFQNNTYNNNNRDKNSNTYTYNDNYYKGTYNNQYSNNRYQSNQTQNRKQNNYNSRNSNYRQSNNLNYRTNSNNYNNNYNNYDNYDNYYNDYGYYNQNYAMGNTKKKKKKTSSIIFAINVLVFVICAAYLGNYYYHSKVVQGKQADLTDKLDTISETSENRYEKIQQEYPNLVGRLLFHNYNDIIDLPVMQTKDEPLYYLYRDQDGEKSNWGTPFIDYRCDVGKPTTNFVVYAHNMKDLSQFGSLKNYKDESYWKKYPTVEFETMYEDRYKYEVVAAFYTQIYDSSVTGVFKYYTFFDTDSEEEYNNFISNIKKIAQYDTGITPKFGEQLLTMSTCDYTQKVDEGRFVVVARKAGLVTETNSQNNTSTK